jgi:hypothetical protein
MRLVLRVLLFEFALAWAMVLAGSVRLALQVWPFVAGAARAGLRRRTWRVGGAVLAGLPVVAGWPALFLPTQAESTAGDWLKVAIPWWLMIGALGVQVFLAKLAAAGPRAQRRSW